jgi:hypothetical protein
MRAWQSFRIEHSKRVSRQRTGGIRAPGERRRCAMTSRVRKCQAKQCIMWRFGEGAQLTTIGEEIVQRQHRSRGSFTTRLIAQAVVTTRRESRDSRSSGRLWCEGTSFQDHGETGLPANGGEPTAGRRDSRRPARRSHAMSQTTPATRPPHTAVAVSTGKR